MTYLRLTLATVALSGCGLIDSNVTDFDLTLPDKMFSINADGWQVDQTASDMLFSYSCTDDTPCATAATAACSENCSGTCSDAGMCELGLDVALYQLIDLVTEKPELKDINDRAVIEVTIDSVRYAVTANTLTVETPELGVYVAPMSIMDPNDPMATKIGTVPPVPAGATVATRDLEFTPDGKMALIDIMSTYKTPFNIIVGSQIIVSSASEVPAGKLDAIVQIKAHAGL